MLHHCTHLNQSAAVELVPFCLQVDLLGLLNWRSNPDDLEQILQRLMEVEGSEIVKVSKPKEDFGVF